MNATYEKVDDFFAFHNLGKDQELSGDAKKNIKELIGEVIPGGIMGAYVEPGFPIYTINDDMLRHMGYTYRELIDETDGLLINMVHPEDRRTVEDAVNGGPGHDSRYDVTYRLMRKGSEHFWVQAKGRLVTVEDGRTAVISIHFDIDDFKLSEQQVIHERNLLQKRFEEELADEQNMENQHEGVMRINVTHDKVEKIINNFADQWDHGVEVGMRLAEMRDCFRGALYPDDKDHFFKQFSTEYLVQQYDKGNKTYSFTQKHKLPAGSTLWFDYTLHLRRNPVTGDLVAFVIVENVTGRELLQMSLKNVAFHEFERIVIVDSVTGRYLLFSSRDIPEELRSGSYHESYLKIFSFDNGDVFEGFSEQLSFESITKNVKEKGDYSFRIDGVKDGKQLTKRINVLSHQEVSNAITIVCSDVTEVVRAEQENHIIIGNALREAERANNAKTDFLSQMSHDMRTPMNAIINLTMLAREDIGDDAKLTRDLDQLESSATFLLSLINDILDMSRIESGKIKLVPSVYRHRDFINYMDGIIVPLCRDKDIEFVWDKGTTDFSLLVDITRFNQLFFNLISNAVKYTDAGGRISFSVLNNTVIDGNLSCDYVVSDNGIGMSEEFLEKAFQPFEREDRVSAYTGSGLGLAIAKQIVDLMGGTITVESKLNVGTKVTVNISAPIVGEDVPDTETGSPAEPAAEIPEIADAEGTRILIVEDHPLNREIVMRILEKKGYLVECVEDGIDAVKAISTCDPWYYHAILMDIRMPGLNGLDAAREIRKMDREYAKAVPIIAMTANAYEEDVQASMAAGMNAHLSKPVEPDRLYKTLAMFARPLKRD
ncbi:MAG: response regulator [Bacillota bacterium]|nr:response regulator [Bacillota bacterium]